MLPGHGTSWQRFFFGTLRLIIVLSEVPSSCGQMMPCFGLLPKKLLWRMEICLWHRSSSPRRFNEMLVVSSVGTSLLLIKRVDILFWYSILCWWQDVAGCLFYLIWLLSTVYTNLLLLEQMILLTHGSRCYLTEVPNLHLYVLKRQGLILLLLETALCLSVF